jgi:hypothetical protein
MVDLMQECTQYTTNHSIERRHKEIQGDTERHNDMRRHNYMYVFFLLSNDVQVFFLLSSFPGSWPLHPDRGRGRV